ncbi:MAG TPA: TonB family protein [Kofleriaceae bacterium]
MLVHGTVLGSVEAFDLAVFGQSGMSTRKLEAAQAVALKSNCRGDALLASSARVTMCFAPWRSDTDDCLNDARFAMYMDLSGCVQTNDQLEVAAINLMNPKSADKVTPIDPEPLLEMMKELEQPKPPPPPELAQQQPNQQKPAPPPPPAQARPAQVVETARPTAEKPPENTRFVSEFDTSVKKQSVARGSVQEPMIAKSKPAELTPKQDAKEASIKEDQPDRQKGANKDAPDVPGTLAMRKEGAQNPSDTQQDAKTKGSSIGASGPIAFDGIVPKKGDGAFEQQRRERSEIPRGQQGAGGGVPDVPNLKPSQEVLERAIGGGNVDHLDDVDNGDETALNAKRWIHASFYNRLKRQVAQNWDPGSVWRRRDPTGSVYGYKTRVTEVRVSLTTKGEVAKIVVTHPSGVTELDDEAVRAFQHAAPFVNTPKELAGEDGLITFSFAFYFEIGAPRSSWRVIRSM